MGIGLISDKRGVSDVLALTILVGLTVTGALLVVYTGQSTVSDSNDQRNAQLAEETFLQADQVFSQYAREGTIGERSVTVPDDIRSGVEVADRATYEVRLDDNPDCRSGPQRLGSLQYQGESTLVGYQGGGVWQLSDGGTSMSAPPDMTYRDGSLSVNFPTISGSINDDGEIYARSNRTVESRANRNLTADLFFDDGATQLDQSNIACNPKTVSEATVMINDSRFAGAWARYAQDRWGGKYVTVSPSTDVAAGENVSITFKLGDISDPKYEVTALDVSREDATNPIEVNATVSNVGGLSDTQDITFRFQNDSTVVLSDRVTDVSLDGGNSTAVSFTVNQSVIDNDADAGTYNFTVGTQDNTTNETRTLKDSAMPPDFQIVDTDTNSTMAIGENSTVNVTVENVGGMTGTQTVSVAINGTTTRQQTVTLDPDTTKTIELELDTRDDGRFEWNVSTDDDDAVDTYVVGSSGYLSIESVTADSSLDTDDQFDLATTIENTGQLASTQMVRLRIENDSWSKWQNTSVDLNGSLQGAESESPTLAYDGFAPSDTGTYTYVVETDNETQTGTFVVGGPDRPNFAIQSVDVSEDLIAMGDEVTFNVTVTNTGNATGEQYVTLGAEGESSLLLNESVTLDGGDTATVDSPVTLSGSYVSIGDNTLNASTENTSIKQPLEILEEDVVEDEEQGITVEEGVRANVELLGSELNAITNSPYYTIIGPVEVFLEIEYENGTVTTEQLWDDSNNGNVGHPNVTSNIVDGTENPYKTSLDLPAGSTVKLFAESYLCDTDDTYGQRNTSIANRGTDSTQNIQNPAWGLECDPGDWNDLLTISGNDNEGNVWIGTNGDRFPGGVEAREYQRDVQQMLGAGRVNGNGDLSLAQNERVFAFEMNEDDASIDESGDPENADYNDAFVSFQVTSIIRETDPPANLVAEDLDVPANPDYNEDVELDATINNTGGQNDTADVEFWFDGSREETKSRTFVAGEPKDLSFEVPTDQAGTFEYTITVTGDNGTERSGFITVGPEPDTNYIVTEMQAPSTVEKNTTANVTATIENTGGASGDQTVVLNATGTAIATENAIISSGDSTDVTLSLPTDTTGPINYRIETEDVITSAQTLFVGQADVGVNSVEVGLTGYDEGALIERRQDNIDTTTVGVVNEGTIGAERTINFTLRNANDDSVLIQENETITLGEGRLGTNYPVWESFDTSSLDAGFYEYTVAVEDEGTEKDNWTGEIYLTANTPPNNGPGSNSPINVDPDQIIVSDDEG